LPINPEIPSIVANGGLTEVKEIVNKNTLSATLSSNGSDVQYYDKTDGKFYRVDTDGNVTALSDKIFHDVQTIAWAPNRQEAILEYPDGANILYNFNKQQQVTLPQHWQDFNFSPSGDKIVLKSMGLDPSNRWLAISNPDGSKVQAIEPMGEEDASVYTDWSPNNQMIAMHTKGVDFNRQEVYFIGLNDENFKSMVIEGRGFQPQWSTAGDKLMYSVYSSDNDMKPLLWIADAQGDNVGNNRHSLNVETWASKCAFSSDNKVYCAVPESLDKGAGLFPELAKNTKDQLYQIDTDTGIKKLIAVPDGTYNMSDLIISDNGGSLVFTDNNSERLYKIKLK
jgi:hypothetical protein